MAVAVVSLGLGIGANATIFNFVNAIEFRPLPFPEPERLMDVSEDNPAGALRGLRRRHRVPHLPVLAQERRRSFTALGAYREDAFALAGEGEPERVGGAAVSATLFPILGCHPGQGTRPSPPPTMLPARPRSSLLGYGLWLRRFGGDTAIIGKTVRVNGVPRTVIGIMPPRFAFPEFAALWLPMAGEASIYRRHRARDRYRRPAQTRRLRGPGRRRDGEPCRSSWPRRTRRAYHGWIARVGPLKPNISNDTSGEAFLLALGASAFVLLIACANLANLFLVRTTSRARELAVRVALGASRSRIAVHLLVESMLLGLAGGVVGLLLSFWGVRYVSGLINTAMPFWIRLGTDWRFLLYTLVLSLRRGDRIRTAARPCGPPGSISTRR